MSETISTGAIVIFLMLLMYMVLGTIIEHFHMQFGHEAAYTILAGKFHGHGVIFALQACSYLISATKARTRSSAT